MTSPRRPIGLCLGVMALATTWAPVPASAEVRIGLAAPLSGPDAVYGLQLRAGVDQAVADINAGGGLLGQRVIVVTGDDGGDVKRGIAAADDLVRDKVPVVIGPFSSSIALPTSAIYAAGGTLDIMPAATAPQITERGLATIFRLAAREDRQATVAAQYLARHYDKVAILHDRTTAGKALADAVRQALRADGVRDVLYAGITKGDKDFASLVGRLKASGTRVAFWGGTQTEAGLLARQLHEAGAPVVLMGGVGIASDEFATLAGPGAEGTLMVFPADPKQRPEAADLLRKLAARGTEPAAYVFNAYAAVQVIQQAVEAAGSLDPAALARVMHEGQPFRTVLGTISFDEKGDLTAPDYSVQTWHRGPTGRVGF